VGFREAKGRMRGQRCCNADLNRSPDQRRHQNQRQRHRGATMTSKFYNVHVEEDTSIIFQTEATFGDHEVLYQKWQWEGITAESIIFVTEEIADIDDETLLNEIKASPLVQEESEITVKTSETGFTFFNFNFAVS
jgi:outer membrane scaffolding protein for murein synthesis (MipA/OmpV family)